MLNRIFGVFAKTAQQDKQLARDLLKEMKRDLKRNPIPLQETMLTTIDHLKEVVDDKRPVTTTLLKSAALIDHEGRGNPIVKVLLTKDPEYSLRDVEFIRKVGNHQAADLLEEKLLDRGLTPSWS